LTLLLPQQSTLHLTCLHYLQETCEPSEDVFATMKFGQAVLASLTSLVALSAASSSNVSVPFFLELEQLARLVDVTYCVGTPALGIQKPFSCPSRCGEFDNIELIQVCPCLGAAKTTS
jgi:hypothetical protein